METSANENDISDPGDHSNPFSNENECFFMRFRISSTLNTRKRCWKRELSKATSNVSLLPENPSFWKGYVSSVDRWRRRPLKTVPKKASNAVVSISIFGRFGPKRIPVFKKLSVSYENELVCSAPDTSFSLACGRNKNVSLVENILLRFRGEEDGRGLNLGISDNAVVWARAAFRDRKTSKEKR